MKAIAPRDVAIWLFFAAALMLATAPVWRVWAFGFNPTFDQLLQLSICGGRIEGGLRR